MRETQESPEKKLEVVPGLTLRVVILLIIWTIGGTWFFLLDRAYATIWNEGGQIPAFVIILLSAILGEKLGLHPAEIATLLSAEVFLYGHRHILNGIPMDNGVTWAGWVANTIPAAIRNPTIGPVVKQITPEFMFPSANRELLAEIIYRGLRPGETFPLGDFVLPALYWTTFATLLAAICSFLVFGVVGKSWVEVEKLAFPHAVAVSYALDLLKEEPSTSKAALFNLKIPRTRIFWWGILLGLLIGIIPILSEIIPGLAAFYLGSWGFAVFKVEPLASLLPGAYSLGVPQYPEMFLCFMLLSNETVWSILILYVVFGIIYQTVVVQLGLAPYKPGDEFAWNWDAAAFGNKLPFPYTWIAISGASIGAGICLLWSSRGRLRELYEILRGKRPDEIDQGLSMKRVTQMGLVAGLVLIIFLTVSGMPIHIVIAVLIFYVLYYLMMSRAWADLWIHHGDWSGVINYVTYPLGAATGVWSWIPEGGNYANFMTQMITRGSGWSSWTVRCGAGMGSPGLVNYYAVCRRTGVNLKHVLYAVLGVSFLGFFTAYLANLWMWVHGGGTSRVFALSGAGTLLGVGVAKGDLVWSAAAPTPEVGYLWFIIGAIIAISTYIARMKFPFVPFNPYIYNPILACLPWYWPNALIAIILKFILVRTMGLRRFTEVFTPIAAGIIIGSGILAFPKYIHHLLTVSWPTFLSYYVP